MHNVFLALGGNQGDPLQCFMLAHETFSQMGTIKRCSGIYQTAPQGGPPQPDYLNAVLWLETSWSCEEILMRALQTEHRCGRVRSERFGPRTLDIDILLYDDAIIERENLIIPHPRLHLRRFVLEPLQEIAPNLVIPAMGPVQSLLQHVITQRVIRVQDWPSTH